MIAVLFARADSAYKTLPGCDVYDIERDARTWRGGCPAVAHPPCRAWGQFHFFAKPRPDEKELALWAVEQVRRWGGVLEHPAQSAMWAGPEPASARKLARPSARPRHRSLPAGWSSWPAA